MHEISQINSLLVIVLPKTIYNKICYTVNRLWYYLLVEQMHFETDESPYVSRKLYKFCFLLSSA